MMSAEFAQLWCALRPMPLPHLLMLRFFVRKECDARKMTPPKAIETWQKGSSMMPILNSFGSISLADGLDLQVGGQGLVIQPLGQSRYAYRRLKADETLFERILVSVEETPQILIYPNAPASTPQRFAQHLLLKLLTPIVLQPEATVEVFLTAPFEVGLFTVSRGAGLHLVDAFSLGRCKYALYGSPENGLVCQYHPTRVGFSAFEAKRFEEAACRFVFGNTSQESATVSRVLLEAPSMTFYYSQDTVFLENMEVAVESADVASVHATDQPPRPGLQRVPARDEGEKKRKLTMEWGY